MTVYEEYAARGRTAWWLYPLAVLLALAMSAGAVVMFGVVLAVSGQASGFAARLTKPSPLFFYGEIGLTFGLLLAGFIIAARLVQAKKFGDIIGRWPWRLFGLGAALWLAVQILSTVLDLGLAPKGFSFTLATVTPTLTLAAIASLAVQTFAEEFVFRGYLTQGLLRLIGKPFPTAIVSGLAFGALHIPNGVPQAVGATAFGVATALIAIRTGGIAATYGLHLVNNLFGGLVVVSAGDVFKGLPGLISQNTPQLTWVDTGVEAAALLAALWFFTRASPRALPDSGA